MSLDPTWLFLSLIPSGIGFVLFMYGKKQERWLHAALEFYLEFHRTYEQLDGCVVNDVLVIAELLRPGTVTFQPTRIAVDLDPVSDAGPVAIEIAADRPLALPSAEAPGLGAVFRQVAAGPD